MAGANHAIADYERQIKDEQARMESRSRDKRDRANAKLHEAQASIAEKEQQVKAIAEQRQRLAGEAEAAHAEGSRLMTEQKSMAERVRECEEQIRRCEEMERSKYAQFGNRMDSVVSQIQSRNWHGQPPVGPFGLYVKVKEPERWGDLLRIVIGNDMSSFAVTDARDRPVLADILEKSGK